MILPDIFHKIEIIDTFFFSITVYFESVIRLKIKKFHQIIDKDLIAGIKVVINGYQYEYTIKDELTKRKNKIIQAIKEEENYGK